MSLRTNARSPRETPFTFAAPIAWIAALPLSMHLASCAEQPQIPKPPAEISVRTAVAESRAVRRTRGYPGITASVRPVQIAARVQGFLEKQHAADGATVRAGDLLYTIDKRPFEAALAQARAGVAQAEAQRASADSGVAQANAALEQAKAQVPGALAARDLAKRDVERNQPLVASGAISQQSFDSLNTKLVQSESTLESAQAAVRTAEAQVAAAKSQVVLAAAQVAAAEAQVTPAELNLSYCTVTAPMDGLLGKSLAYEGQMVGPNFAVELNTIVVLDPMWVQFSPSATEWPLIAAELADGAVEASIVYGGDESIRTKGKLVFSANSVDTSTSTILLRAEFPNTAGAFRPGTYAEVELDLGEIPGVVMIPTAALVARETDFFVWRVKADSTVENVRVEASVREGELVGISKGLAAGDRVVSAGVQKLADGAKVVEAPPAGSAGNAANPAGNGE
jgi:RND family efflux transporter MFP subunit